MEQIGRYQVSSKIGQGAFGRVFRALDPVVGREVAIKTIEAGGDREVIDRLRNEAMMTASLVHRNIVTIFEFGESSGFAYIVMELVQGAALQELVDSPARERNPAALLDYCRILVQAADGLSYAHARGVVHSDVKPLNIIREASGTIKIVDFGLARVLDTGATAATRTAGAIGTVMYMAPEQLVNSRSDTLTDIFSFGTTAYELLCGQHPFPGEDLGTVIYRLEACNPVALRECNDAIPERLAEVVHRCLARDRDLRYQSMGDVYGDLQSVLQDVQYRAAEELFATLPAPHSAQDPAEALKLLRRVLDLQPGHAQARTLRAGFEARQRDESKRQRVSSLLAEGDALAGRRSLLEAINKYEAALRMDPENADISRKLDEIRQRQERRRAAARLVVEARAQFEAGNVDLAFREVQEAILSDPANEDALELQDAVAGEIARREAADRLRQAIGEVEVLLDNGELDLAASETEKLAAAHPESEEVAETARRIAEAIAERDRVRRRAEFEGRLREVEAAATGDLDSGLRVATDLLRDYPDQSQAITVLTDMQGRVAARDRERAVKALVAGVQSELAAGNMDQAAGMLEGQKTLGPDPRFEELATAVQSAIARRNREREMEAVISKGEQALRALDFSVIADLQSAVLRYPENEKIHALLGRTIEAREQELRKRFVTEACAEAASLTSKRAWETAETRLRQAMQRYPDDPVLAEALGGVHQAFARYTADVQSRVREIEAALSGKNLLDAIRLADESCRVFGNEIPVLELAARVWREARRHELQLTSRYVNECLKCDDIETAEAHLSAMNVVFAHDNVSKVLAGEVEQRRTMRDGVRTADRLISELRYDEAARMLSSIDTTTEYWAGEVRRRQELIASRRRESERRASAS